jgi:malonyl-CoA O-methyltransferase
MYRLFLIHSNLQIYYVNLLNPPRLDKIAVKKSFNRGAADYDKCAVLQAEVLKRLLERLEYIKLQPEWVVDLGCGTGQAIKPLTKKYRHAQVVALDMADAMLHRARKNYGLFDRKYLLNADMEVLPFKSQSVDMVFSSLALQWSNDLHATFKEFKRVGRSGGVILFTTLGANTLRELRESWKQIDPTPRVHQFMDMHDVGDAMLAAGLSQPVVDMEEITLEYDKFPDLMRDLKGIGATNADRNRSRGLMTPAKLKRLQQAYEQLAFDHDRYQATYEVVYGHAWF